MHDGGDAFYAPRTKYSGIHPTSQTLACDPQMN